MCKKNLDELYESLCMLLETRRLYLDENLSLDGLSQELSSNRTYVSRAMSMKSVSFSQLVNSFRARHAIDLIMKEDCRSVKLVEIAEASGFSSLRTMNRYVKQSAGVSACALRCRLYGPGRTTVQPL